MNKYRVVFPSYYRGRGKYFDVEANTSYEAAKEAARIFNLRGGTRDLTVILTELDDTPVAIDPATLGS
jgi:hypothetical protein